MSLGCQRMFYDTALVSARSRTMTTEPNRAALDLTYKALLPALSPLFPPELDLAPCSHVEGLNGPSPS